MRLSTLSEDKHLIELKNILHYEKGVNIDNVEPIPKRKSARGSEDILLREIFKLRSSEVAGYLSFSIYFLHLQSFQGGQPSYMKKYTLPESLKNRGHVPPVPLVPSWFLPPSAHSYAQASILGKININIINININIQS